MLLFSGFLYGCKTKFCVKRLFKFLFCELFTSLMMCRVFVVNMCFEDPGLL